jgi:hypothetical protein
VILSQHEQFPYTRQAVHREAWNQIHELGEDVTGIRCVRNNRILLAKTAE